MRYTRVSFDTSGEFDEEIIKKSYASLLFKDNKNIDRGFKHILCSALRGVIETELAPRQRQIFAMYFFLDMKSPKIAENLGISRQAVTKSLRSSRKKIAECLKYCLEKRK